MELSLPLAAAFRHATGWCNGNHHCTGQRNAQWCAGRLARRLQKSHCQPLTAATASPKHLSGPQLLFPPAGAGLRCQQQPLAEPATVFDGGNGQRGRQRQWTTKTAFNRGIKWGHCMVAVGFCGGDGQQQGGGKVKGEKRRGHRHNNQIKGTTVAAAAAAAAAVAASSEVALCPLLP